jgi:hypothetical protein
MADRGGFDIRLEAAMAKLFCTEALWRTVDAGVQIRGGRGYETAESLRGRGEPALPMERMLRDARINLIIEGTSEIMRLFIAREALDPHLRAAGVTAIAPRPDWRKAVPFYAAWYPQTFLRRSLPPLAPAELQGHLRYLDKASRRLARDLFHMVARFGPGLQRRQMILARLVDAGAELFAMAAVLSRATSTSAPEGGTSLADLFCRQARRRVEGLRRLVYRNDDSLAYRAARDILAGNFSWLEENIVSAWKEGPNRS